MTEEELIAGCDPGIREAVALLRRAGYETCDSGDGVTKATWTREGGGEGARDVGDAWVVFDDYLPYPHVYAPIRSDRIVAMAKLARALLGEPWIVEVSYSANDDTAILCAYRKLA